MAFRIEIRFSGLCHLVDDPAGTAMCVVLPKAQHHEAKIERRLGVIIRESDGEAVSSIDLNNARVEFSLTGGQGGGDFHFNIQDGNTFAVVPFTKLVDDDFIQPDSQMVTEPRPNTVEAQIFIRKGTLGPESSPTFNWLLPQSIFKENEEVITVSAKALWDLRPVENAKFTVKKITGQGEETYRIESFGNLARLEIYNECTRDDAPRVDRDFKNHYNLLHPPKLKAIKDELTSHGEDPENVPLPTRLENLLRFLTERRDFASSTTWRLLQEKGMVDPGEGTPVIEWLSGVENLLADMEKEQSAGIDPDELRDVHEEVERVLIKAISSNGSGGGCNCLGCYGGSVVIPDPV